MVVFPADTVGISSPIRVDRRGAHAASPFQDGGGEPANRSREGTGMSVKASGVVATVSSGKYEEGSSKRSAFTASGSRGPAGRPVSGCAARPAGSSPANHPLRKETNIGCGSSGDDAGRVVASILWPTAIRQIGCPPAAAPKMPLLGRLHGREAESAVYVWKIKTPRARGRLAGPGVEAGLGERKASGMHSGERVIRQRTLRPLRDS
jgi:hypothetical protein